MKTTMKKLASVALALTLALALAAPTFAANVTINEPAGMPEDATYTAEYTAYKILTAEPLGETSAETEDGQTLSSFTSVAYSIANDSPFHDVIVNFEKAGVKVFNVYPKNDTTDVVALADGVDTFDAADLATALKAVIDEQELTGIAFNGATAELTDGYFLILSSLGSKMIVDTFGQEDMTINTKNDFPTMTKTIVVGEEEVGSTTASYGDTVTFKLTVAVPGTAVGAMTAHDKMDDGLTYAGWTAIEGVTANTTTEDGCTVEFVISEAVVAANRDGEIVITYTATLDSDADINTAIKNTAHLTYANYETPDDVVEVYTYAFDLKKVNSDGDTLTGAQFELYKGETKIDLVATEEGGYRVAVTGENPVEYIEAGEVNIKGLADGEYALRELKAPEGYNKLSTDVTFKIEGGATKMEAEENDDNADENGYITVASVDVVNLTGAELPSTGGIGTTIFYIAGGVLAVGAGILLVTKKRMGAEEE